MPAAKRKTSALSPVQQLEKEIAALQIKLEKARTKELSDAEKSLTKAMTAQTRANTKVTKAMEAKAKVVEKLKTKKTPAGVRQLDAAKDRLALAKEDKIEARLAVQDAKQLLADLKAENKQRATHEKALEKFEKNFAKQQQDAEKKKLAAKKLAKKAASKKPAPAKKIAPIEAEKPVAEQAQAETQTETTPTSDSE